MQSIMNVLYYYGETALLFIANVIASLLMFLRDPDLSESLNYKYDRFITETTKIRPRLQPLFLL